ncbi:hypothetical protein ACQEU3_47045 [Spirillospora sp. CA-253888]
MTDPTPTPAEIEPCHICADGPEECTDCHGDGTDGGGYTCTTCNGSGQATPEHCCDCGSSPYCTRCHTCGHPCAGNCRCPIPVRSYDGEIKKVL